LKSSSDSRLLSLETTVTNRLADVESFIHWEALQQSYARDLKAIHDEMRFREQVKKKKKDLVDRMEQSALWDPAKGPWKSPA
jgi:predicted GIY-YIG superfamily endonuclease